MRYVAMPNREIPQFGELQLNLHHDALPHAHSETYNYQPFIEDQKGNPFSAAESTQLRYSRKQPPSPIMCICGSKSCHTLLLDKVFQLEPWLPFNI